MDGRPKRSEMNESSNENVLVWTRPKALFKRPTYRLMREIYCSYSFSLDATFEPGITNNLTAIILACKRIALFMNW